MTCDGEARQIELFQEQQILRALATNLIDLGKIAASCSAICQAFDVSDFFKATKKVLDHVILEDYKDERLFNNIITALDQRFTTEKRKHIADSLCQAIYVIRDSLAEKIIKQGYQRCGQWSLNFNQTMSLCSKIPDKTNER